MKARPNKLGACPNAFRFGTNGELLSYSVDTPTIGSRKIVEYSLELVVHLLGAYLPQIHVYQLKCDLVPIKYVIYPSPQLD